MESETAILILVLLFIFAALVSGVISLILGKPENKSTISETRVYHNRSESYPPFCYKHKYSKNDCPCQYLD